MILAVIIYGLFCMGSGVVYGADVQMNLPDGSQSVLPGETEGFKGTFTGEVVNPNLFNKKDAVLAVKVIEVLSLDPDNKTTLDAAGLTKVWKDKLCVVRGLPDMPEIKKGDKITITAARVEKHFRPTNIAPTQPAVKE